jgi:hypothetical protein
MRNLAKHLPDSSGFDLKHILVEPGKPISLKKDFEIRRTAQIGKRLGQDWRSDVGAFAYS